jgi:hypothetical protein
VRQAAPGRLLPRGRTRTGLEVETITRSTGPMVTHGTCSDTSTPDHRPTKERPWRWSVTIEQANAPVAGGPAGRGVRASDLNGPGVLPAGAVRQARNSKSAWRPSAVTAAHRPFQVLHTPWRSTGAKRPPPFDPLTPFCGDAPSTATWSPLSPGHARGRLQPRAGGSRGGAPYGSRPHWWTGCQIERLPNGRRYLGSARGARLARRSSASSSPRITSSLRTRSSRAWLAVHPSRDRSAPSLTPRGAARC